MENYKFINKQTGEVLATIGDVLRRVISDYKHYRYFSLFDWQSTEHKDLKRFINKYKPCLLSLNRPKLEYKLVPKLYRVTAVLNDTEYAVGAEWTEDILANTSDEAALELELKLSERRISIDYISVELMF